MNFQPTLSNEFVLLRPLRQEDYEELYQVAMDPAIWEQHPCQDRYQATNFRRFFEESIHSQGALLVIEQSTGNTIGSSRFKPIEGTSDAVEIGWSFLARDYWGGRYNKAVKQLMIDHAFEFVTYVVLYVGKENLRSQRAVEKIGGRKIFSREFPELVRREDTDWTYVLRKQ